MTRRASSGVRRVRPPECLRAGATSLNLARFGRSARGASRHVRHYIRPWSARQARHLPHAGREIARASPHRAFEVAREVGLIGVAEVCGLARPLTREIIMRPDADIVAITAYHDNSIGFGAAIVAYDLYHRDQHAAVAESMYGYIQRERAKKSRRTTALAPPLELRDSAEEILAGRREPHEAIETVVRKVNARSARRFAGLALELSSTKAFDFPSVLLEPESLDCAVVVTHTRKPGEAWGEWVIFVMYAVD